ncbi:MAG: OmpA family protein [Alphaproteobacteria bacterium]|nr:OmpA family protein [Alphaproteobacteria bacterium]
MKKTLSILLLGTALLTAGCSHRCYERGCSMQKEPPKATCSQKTPAHFAFDSAQLDGTDKANLMKVADWMKQNPSEKVRINGYTDNTGPTAYNMHLSQKRAQSTAAYLESLGISADRITTHGYGASHFMAPNDTSADRAKNRRIEISFYQ